ARPTGPPTSPTGPPGCTGRPPWTRSRSWSPGRRGCGCWGRGTASTILAAPPGEVPGDHDAGTVTVPAAMRYGELAARLRAEGLALANLASLPHISVRRALAPATPPPVGGPGPPPPPGSGDANGNLATAVAGLELVTGTGELLSAARGDPDFD